MISNLKRLHRFLLPQRADLGWTPYLWLVYLTAFVIPWITGEYHLLEHGAHGMSLVVFLFLFFRGYWAKAGSLVLVIAGMTVVGVIMAQINSGAMVFFVYASAYCSRFQKVRTGILVLIFLASFTGVYLGLLDTHWMTAFFGTLMTAIIGIINLYYAQLARKDAQLRMSQEEVRHLATVAERERIARDLHDLLGHTLSVIALKSELASKLMDRKDHQRAAGEIKDVEEISRKALKQVREAVVGYRDTGLAGEAANARKALEALDVTLEYQPPQWELTPNCDAVLAMVLREGVTNVIRHSEAARCRIVFSRENGILKMMLEDDGKGGPIREGGGLSGMRDRLASIGGDLTVEDGDGVKLCITIPEENQSTGVEHDTCGHR